MTEGLYPIRTISAMTGVNPVTLRAWERRYGLIRPQRTPKGHRLYTQQDIERIQQILMLLERGIPISQAKQVLDGQETQPASEGPADAGQHSSWRTLRRRWEDALVALDGQRLEQAHAAALGLFPMDSVIHELALPLLTALHDAAGDDLDSALRAQFLHTFLRHKLAARLHHQTAYASGPRLLLAAAAGSHDELGLMVLATAAQSHGYRCMLLGTDVAATLLQRALEHACCAGLVLSGETEQPPDGLMDMLAAAHAPVFLLADAANWLDDQPPEHLFPVTVADRALNVIGRRIPPVSGGIAVPGLT